METHLIGNFIRNVDKYGTREVFRHRNDSGNYESISWIDLKRMVEQTCSFLVRLGVKEDEMVGIFSQNKYQWMVADLAIMAIGAVSVPMYATSSPDQISYISRETNMKVMFVGNQEQFEMVNILMQSGSTLEKLISFQDGKYDKKISFGFQDVIDFGDDKAERFRLEDTLESLKTDRLATVIYTSGTTGEPKGVMLGHDNFSYCFKIHDQRLDLIDSDISMCFLPLSHVFERMWSHYLIYKGAVNVFLENPRQIIDELKVVKPTVMCAVPRFFEKTHSAIHDELGRWKPFKAKVFRWAMQKGHEALVYRFRSEKPPLKLRMQLKLADKLVHKNLQKIFGGKLRFMPCAGAALNTDILKFFHAAGIFINYGYGATETTATVSCFLTDYIFPGTCGTIMPGVDVRIGEGNEILVKGGTIFKGYYKKPQETAAVLKDGWFYTGDEGYIDQKRNLTMVDRIKDLMKTSVGKYISPQKLETLLGSDELVEQIIVVGDNRKYVCALVVPASEKVKELATKLNINQPEYSKLLADEQIIAHFKQRFDTLQKSLMSYEHVVKFTLLPELFSIEQGTMTNTLKLRRSSIEKRYHDLVESMYA